MADFPQLLEYNTGRGDDRLELSLDRDGNARLVITSGGDSRDAIALVDLAKLHAIWAALERGGFPAIPDHPMSGGGVRTVLAHRADDTKQGGSIAVDAKLAGFDEAFALLDELVRQIR